MFDIGNERVALVTDTACDLLDEQLERFDIRLVSLRVATSQGEFRDRTEINADVVYELLKSELPKTSLPLPEDVSSLYRQLRDEGATRILHICMSGSLSGTYNMVSILADETEDLHVDVVDAQTLSCGTGLLVLFRTNHSTKQNLLFVVALLLIGLFMGLLLDLTGLSVLMHL